MCIRDSGTIGQKVADLGLAFGMNVIATKRNIDGFNYPKVKIVPLDELIEQSDVLSLNASLNDSNLHIIDKALLQRMKSNAILINTARGPLINESDLSEALTNNIIAGAGLDVLSDEPPMKDNPLIGLNNCIITPHISWATKESRLRLIDIVASNISAFFNGTPINVVQ